MRVILWPEGSQHEHASDIDEHLEQPSDMMVLVAELGEGRLGGFIELSLRSTAEGCVTRPVGYIEGWYVDADVRRRGIGRALVEAGEQWAIDRGCSEMASDALLDNLMSHTAHGRLGYEEVERIVCFRKALASTDRRSGVDPVSWTGKYQPERSPRC